MPRITIDKQDFISSIPIKTGIYRFLDKKNNILYIGKAVNIRARIRSHFKDENPKTKLFLVKAKYLEYIITDDEIEALILEANQIKKYLPKYNIDLKDDKYFPYLEINIHDKIPSIKIVHKTDNPNSLYFGPYPNSHSLFALIKYLRQLFPFCTHKKPYKSCLYIHLGLCPFPYQNLNEEKYLENIRNIVKILQGHKQQIIKELTKQRIEAVKTENFESAKELTEKLNLLHRKNHIDNEIPYQLIKNKKEVLLKITKLLSNYGYEINNLAKIEGYDISDTQGTNAVASMVVNVNGQMEHEFYRRFRIKSVKQADDYAMLKEAVSRRLRHPEWTFPEILLIDGGFGQLDAVNQLFSNNQLNILCISLAKREEIICLPNGNTIKLERSDPVLHLFQEIRDEAHRFANSYHKLLRSKRMLSNENNS